ncbi:MAG: hypothetical protein K0R39_2409 [Symbiobacteriaceae bacterium]|jgi:hypothetical protein|nr:hypothetical protein [Symbiobacteriaceae bacterium]
MGRRRKRLIVQADLTSEEDQAFIAWVLERRRKRRLAEEIRQGLQLQYRRQTQRPTPATQPEIDVPLPPSISIQTPAAGTSGSAASKLARLVGGF